MSKAKPERLHAEERHREILNVVSREGRITVEEVSRRFGISVVTARSDLDVLSKNGALIRSHGGGIKPLPAQPEHPLRVREGMHHEEKVRIARAAAQLIQPFQTVILCTGSTSVELAEQLRHTHHDSVTFITYALNVAAKLAETPNVSLVMLGGLLRRPSTAFVGPHAEQVMQSLHADHCFMSTVGIDADLGLTTLDIMEAQLNQRMIAAASQVTVLADSSKFGQRSLAVISDFTRVHRVITDSAAPAAQIEKLKTKGIEVLLV
jgi:DeoR family transcriptional regulator, aga operon transcriptional repressor